MFIEILSITKETKQSKKGKPYQAMSVAYKNGDGKIEGKNLTEYAEKSVWETLSSAVAGDKFDVKSEKDDNGYWQWTTIGRANGTPTPQSTNRSSTAGSTAPKSNYETPEERAKKQIYIVRQSSLSTAVAVLSVGAKAAPKSDDIVALAKQFETYVFEGLAEPAKEVIPVGTSDDMDDDIPF